MTTSGPKTLAATKQFIVVRERVHSRTRPRQPHGYKTKYFTGNYTNDRRLQSWGSC
jgi:hypothetical protein